MKTIKVTGPSIEEILEKFKISITSRNSAKIELYREKDHTTFEVIIDIIDAKIWHLPQSVFNNEEKLKRVLILKGWINAENRTNFGSTVIKNCTVELFVTGDICLKIK